MRISAHGHQGAFSGFYASGYRWVLLPMGIASCDAPAPWHQHTLAHSDAREHGLAVTAYGFLEALKVPRGEYLLQGAAGSTLGRQLIAMAKERGVKTINVVRRKEQVQELLEIG